MHKSKYIKSGLIAFSQVSILHGLLNTLMVLRLIELKNPVSLLAEFQFPEFLFPKFLFPEFLSPELLWL